MTYKDAARLLDDSKTLFVFAPTGMWLRSKEKVEWLRAIRDSSWAERHVIYGDGNSPMEKAIVANRVRMLKKSGVKTYKHKAQKEPKLGFILFDDCAVCGLGDEMKLVTSELELSLLRLGLKELMR